MRHSNGVSLREKVLHVLLHSKIYQIELRVQHHVSREEIPHCVIGNFASTKIGKVKSPLGYKKIGRDPLDL